MEHEDTFTIATPLYVLFSSEKCWKCREPQQVIALAVRYSSEGSESKAGEMANPSLLCEVTNLPSSLLALINAIHAPYRKHSSKTRGQSYFANFCACGANFGDFYLFMEPEGAFFPLDEVAASKITIREISFPKPVEISGNVCYGAEDLIFENAMRI